MLQLTKRSHFERVRSKIADMILFSRPHFQQPLARIRSCVGSHQGANPACSQPSATGFCRYALMQAMFLMVLARTDRYRQGNGMTTLCTKLDNCTHAEAKDTEGCFLPARCMCMLIIQRVKPRRNTKTCPDYTLAAFNVTTSKAKLLHTACAHKRVLGQVA